MSITTILCVDDEMMVLNSLREQLSQAFGDKYAIEISESGEEALEIIHELHNDNTEVAVIISDHIMPGIKGDELLITINSFKPEMRKILLTGQADTDAVGNTVNNAGLYRFITKPWDGEDLVLTVTEAIRSYFQDKHIAKHYKITEVISNVLQLSLQDITLQEQLSKTLDLLLSGPLTATDKKGAIYLVDDAGEFLTMQAVLGLPEEFCKSNNKIPVDACIYINEQPTKAFALQHDADAILCDKQYNAADYSHYCTPIMYRDNILGIISVYLRNNKPCSEQNEFLAAIANTLAGVIQRKKAEEEVKQHRDELAAMVSALREAKQDVETANSARLTFLSHMNHELYTPLNAILGFSGLLIEELAENEIEYDDKQDHFAMLHNILRSSNNLKQIVTDILDITTMATTHQTEKSMAEFSVTTIIDQALKEVMPLIEKNGNTFEIHKINEPNTMLSDSDKLKRILYHLLNNAAKFTENGCIRLEVERIQMPAGEQLRFSVIDTGVGISSENREQLFDVFTQADGSATRQFGGTGAGLAIVKYFCNYLGGTIAVVSEYGKGSTFTVRLPVVLECGRHA